MSFCITKCFCKDALSCCIALCIIPSFLLLILTVGESASLRDVVEEKNSCQGSFIPTIINTCISWILFVLWLILNGCGCCICCKTLWSSDWPPLCIDLQHIDLYTIHNYVWHTHILNTINATFFSYIYLYIFNMCPLFQHACVIIL